MEENGELVFHVYITLVLEIIFWRWIMVMVTQHCDILNATE